MKDDYKIKNETMALNVKVEKEVKMILEAMEKHSKNTVDELVNTALKRFIAQHKDFLPPNYK